MDGAHVDKGIVYTRAPFVFFPVVSRRVDLWWFSPFAIDLSVSSLCSPLCSACTLRRGHAQQILNDGGTLAEVLRAGQWSSPAFLLYLDLAEVESTAVLDMLDPVLDHER